MKQLVYLNFDGGESLSYRNGAYSLENINMESASFSAAEQENILAKLSDEFADSGIVFTTVKPADGEYSTIFIGDSDDFASLGNFSGLSETVDLGNANKSDNAFVLLNAASTLDSVTATIAHEVGHLTGTLTHSGEGIAAFAAGLTYTVTGNASTGYVNVNAAVAKGASAANDDTIEVKEGITYGNNRQYFCGVKGIWDGALSYSDIYGGSSNSVVDGDTSLELQSGKVTAILGGGNGAESNVTGTANLTIMGGEVADVYGGGSNSFVNATNVMIVGGLITNNVWGSSTINGLASVTTNVFISGTAEIKKNIYGGARSGSVGAATVSVQGGRIEQNVFGGGDGANARVGGTTVTLDDMASIGGNVYGGGNSGSVGTSVVTIGYNNISGNIFGGGKNANTGIVYMSIKSGNISGNVYGASENGSIIGTEIDDMGKAEMKITGGNISGNVYGGGLFNGTASVNETINSLYSVTLSVAIGGNAFGGHQISTTGGYTGKANSTLWVDEGNGKFYAGGSSVTASAATNDIITGNSSLIFSLKAIPMAADEIVPMDASIISVSKYAIGGSLVGGSANLTVNGDSSITIMTGNFSGLVSGGGMVQSANATLRQIGHTNVTISGGSFSGNIYGGHITTKLAYSAHTVLNGSTSIIVQSDLDSSVVIGANIFGGSNGTGTVSSGSSITFSGFGANLTFTGKISGDSSSAGTYNGARKEYVSGDRSLNFTGFIGDFNTSGIYNINTVNIAGSTVNMTNTAVDLSNVNNWDIEAGSSLAFGGMNDFLGDALNITGAADGLDWTVFDGGSADSIANWDQLGSVTLFGQTATFDSDLAAWTSTDYKLFADTANNDLKVGMIA